MRNRVIIFLAICSVLTASTLTACGTKKSESDTSTSNAENVGISSTTPTNYETSYTYYDEWGKKQVVIEAIEANTNETPNILDPVLRQYASDIENAMKYKSEVVAFVDGEPIYKANLLIGKACLDCAARSQIGVKSTKEDWEKTENVDKFASIDDCLNSLIEYKAIILEAKSEAITVDDATVMKNIESNKKRDMSSVEGFYKLKSDAFGSEKIMTEEYLIPAEYETQYINSYFEKYIPSNNYPDNDDYVNARKELTAKILKKHEVRIVT